MKCPRCQTEVPVDERVCPACGEILSSTDAHVASLPTEPAGESLGEGLRGLPELAAERLGPLRYARERVRVVCGLVRG